MVTFVRLNPQSPHAIAEGWSAGVGGVRNPTVRVGGCGVLPPVSTKRKGACPGGAGRSSRRVGG